MSTERRYGNLAEPATAAPDVDVEVEEVTRERLDEPWRVILYNDDVHTFDEVILQLIKATGCSPAEAEALAWRVHLQGKAAVYEGSFEECFRVQAILNEIALITDLEG
ncbi:MAG: ATP-dependent Clp protease adaptor ClpS [Bacteroidetes bacterium]|nr:MAG: ATP-dependent Clp protease adaptor ClpS [Bacteroidota bacterium]